MGLNVYGHALHGGFKYALKVSKILLYNITYMCVVVQVYIHARLLRNMKDCNTNQLY